MAKYEIGLESSLIKQVLNGTKTVEVRLNRGKFANFRTGDMLTIRRDHWKDGKIVSSEPTDIVLIVNQATPFSASDTELASIKRFYTPGDIDRYGLLKIGFSLRQ